MSIEIFGLNIGQIVDEAMDAAGGVPTGTLVKVMHGAVNPSDLAAGAPRTTTSYSFRGWIDDGTRDRDGIMDGRTDEWVFRGLRRVTILDNSLAAGIVPRPNDQIVIATKLGTQTFDIAEDGVKTDPAEAAWICYVRGGA